MTDEQAPEAPRDERPTADDAQWQGLQRLWAELGLQHMSVHNYVQAAERAEAMRAKIDALAAENAELRAALEEVRNWMEFSFTSGYRQLLARVVATLARRAAGGE